MSLVLKKAGIKDNDREKVARFCEADFSNSPTLTSQAPADEVNINKIMDRVLKGHTIMTSQGQPFYGDVSDLGGLQDAYIKVQEADELFAQVPASTRELFENDPVAFVQFLDDPKNLDEAVKLGLAKPKPVEPKTPPGSRAGGFSAA